MDSKGQLMRTSCPVFIHAMSNYEVKTLMAYIANLVKLTAISGCLVPTDTQGVAHSYFKNRLLESQLHIATVDSVETRTPHKDYL